MLSASASSTHLIYLDGRCLPFDQRHDHKRQSDRHRRSLAHRMRVADAYSQNVCMRHPEITRGFLFFCLVHALDASSASIKAAMGPIPCNLGGDCRRVDLPVATSRAGVDLETPVLPVHLLRRAGLDGLVPSALGIEHAAAW